MALKGEGFLKKGLQGLGFDVPYVPLHIHNFIG